jgi:hypothetical protein
VTRPTAHSITITIAPQPMLRPIFMRKLLSRHRQNIGTILIDYCCLKIGTKPGDTVTEHPPEFTWNLRVEI